MTTKYQQLPELKLPWKDEESEFVLEGLTGQCASCNKPLTDIRGTITKVFKAIEIDFMGVCHPCKSITSCRGSIYPDDNRFLVRTDKGWNERKMIVKMKDSKRSFVKRFIGKLCPFLIGPIFISILARLGVISGGWKFWTSLVILLLVFCGIAVVMANGEIE